MKRPAFQFYPGDWLRDAGLHSCSLEARGLWIEMLCLMHDGEPYGHLAVAMRPLKGPQIARMIGAHWRHVSRLLAELEAAGVYSVTPSGMIYSRRMVRDEEVRQRKAEGGYKSLENPNVPRPKHRPEDTHHNPPEDTHKGPPEGSTAGPSPAVAVAVAVASNRELQQLAQASPAGGARARQHTGDVSRSDLMGRIRKACAPRGGEVSDADMRSNADIVDRLARSYSFEELAQAVAGRRSRIDCGEIPSMPPGCAWTLRVYWDKDPIRNQIDQDLGAYNSTSRPGPSSEDKRGGTASVSELLDFKKFERSPSR